MKINSNFNKLKANYLFSEIAKRVNKFVTENNVSVIKMGIGDVTRPLCPAVINAMHKAVDEMGVQETFRGYGDEQGYAFLRNAVAKYYQDNANVTLSPDEIFICDGAKSDVGNIVDLFASDNVVLVPDPVYPVYVDTNIMSGRQIIYMDATEDNGFLPLPDYNVDADLIYLCSPNNPTGATYDYKGLEAWVKYALEKKAIILFDSAYEAFINEDNLPRSIFEIKGAKKCAIEFCSLSKTAGFTGTRCGYTVVPHELVFDGVEVNRMWFRRQTTKFNGVSYIVQRGAEAVFSIDGLKQIRENINYYRENANIITKTLDECGIKYFGGKNSPYIWLKCPNGLESWDFFDLLLTKINVVGTPGAGFGENGKNYFRLTAFSTHENTAEAMRRLKELLQK